MRLPNLPNALTLSRIFLVPLLVVVLLTRTERWELIGGAIFGVAAFTDWLDGYLARRRGQVTKRGITIPASTLGKGKMTTQVIAILLLILGKKFLGPFYVLGRVALWMTVILALVSGFDYFLRFYKKVATELPSSGQA